MTVEKKLINKKPFIERQAKDHKIPLAYSSPISVNGEFAKGEYQIPLATTERGLVAGINRGCKAVTEAGGVVARIYKKGFTRAPGFQANNIEEAVGFYRWVIAYGNEVLSWPEAQSRHIHLIEVKPFIAGKNIFLRMRFDCGDSMGGNSVTILSDRISRRLAKERNIEYLTVSSNVCADKKPSAINVLDNRGFGVITGVLLSAGVITNILKTSADKLSRLSSVKHGIGSAFSGAPYHQNSHVANTLAAIYIACGQDVAQIVESSAGFFSIETLEANAAYATLTLPSLEVGVHGGGTEYETARYELDHLGCKVILGQTGRAAAIFAEIVASICLAAEISLLAVLAEGALAEVSARLGRAKY